MKYVLIVVDDKGTELHKSQSDSPFQSIHVGEMIAVSAGGKPVWPVDRVGHIITAESHTVRVHCDMSASTYAKTNKM